MPTMNWKMTYNNSSNRTLSSTATFVLLLTLLTALGQQGACFVGSLPLKTCLIQSGSAWAKESLSAFTVFHTATSGEGRPTASDASLLFTPPLLPSFNPRLSKGSGDVSVIETKWAVQHGDRMAGPLLFPPSASNNARAFVFEFERLFFFSYVTQQPSEYDHRRQSAAVFRLPAPSVTPRDACAWREDGCLFDYQPPLRPKTVNFRKQGTKWDKIKFQIQIN